MTAVPAHRSGTLVVAAALALASLAQAAKDNIVGFHLGPGGNHDNVDTSLKTMDAAGVPFSIKNVDEYGSLLQLAVQLKAASGVNHTIIWRSTNTDVPPYSLDPVSAASQHWEKVKSNMPSDLPAVKEHIWIETINEPDQTKCTWLANFSTSISKLAVAEGWNILNFGWSTGTPWVNAGGGPNCWLQPETQAFLRYAASQEGRVGVAVHEYSNSLNITNEWPWLLGRFHFLFDACDANAIPRPPVAITEWGWLGCAVKLPPPEGIQDIDQVMHRMGQYSYANYPEIRAAMMWYLGPWNCKDPISDQADQLVLPVANYSTQA